MSEKKLKNIAILGASGSIGRQTLDVLERYAEVLGIKIKLLACNKNGSALYSRFASDDVTIISNDEFIASGKARHLVGTDLLAQASTYEDIDIVVNGIGGLRGVLPSFAAVESGATLVTANKESIVSAGKLLVNKVNQKKTAIIPVDSEHSAAFQCLLGERTENVKRIVLTASGGAFRDLTKDEIASRRSADALKHPNWKMGVKVTVDCATLMNKGLEAIEARNLFDVRDIGIAVHRESIIHALVEFRDGSSKLCMSRPDMRIPIQYALSAPNRYEVFVNNQEIEPIGLKSIENLTFSEPDVVRFPCLKTALEVLESDNDYLGAVLCAADDAAVDLYLKDMIGFYGISDAVNDALDRFGSGTLSSPEEILSIEREVGEYILEKYGGNRCF